jgi:hypothetical protein
MEMDTTFRPELMRITFIDAQPMLQITAALIAFTTECTCSFDNPGYIGSDRQRDAT